MTPTLSHSIITMAAGALAASAVVVAKLPSSRRVFRTVAPFQALIGVGLLVWGVYMLAFQLVTIAGSFPVMPIRMTVYLGSILADLAIGFLLGYSVLREHALRRYPDASTRAEQWQRKLLRYQVPLGLIALGTGLGVLIMWLP